MPGLPNSEPPAPPPPPAARPRGNRADRARAAAVQAVPGGTAGEVETETGEGAAAYGVLVTRPDGTRVEVHLDRDFRVLDTEPADGDGG